MDTWDFDLVMECLSPMLQAALLGYALSNYLYFIDSSVVIGFTTSGLFFYAISLFPPLLFLLTVHSIKRIRSSNPPIGTSPSRADRS